MKIYLLGASISVIKIKYIVVKNITFQCLFKIPFIYGISIYKLVKKWQLYGNSFGTPKL